MTTATKTTPKKETRARTNGEYVILAKSSGGTISEVGTVTAPSQNRAKRLALETFDVLKADAQNATGVEIAAIPARSWLWDTARISTKPSVDWT